MNEYDFIETFVKLLVFFFPISYTLYLIKYFVKWHPQTLKTHIYEVISDIGETVGSMPYNVTYITLRCRDRKIFLYIFQFVVADANLTPGCNNYMSTLCISACQIISVRSTSHQKI